MPVKRINPLGYRRKVAEVYLTSDKSPSQMGKRFNIHEATASRWVPRQKEECAVEVAVLQGVSAFKSSNHVDSAMPRQQLPPEQQEQRIRELESRPEQERKHSIVLSRMIGIAERDLKISIRKRPGAKQSG